MNQLNWEIKAFNDLTLDELYDILKLRVDVFVVEQACPYPELDNQDRHKKTLHLMGKNDRNDICAYLRILAPGVSSPHAGIGRVVVNKANRGKGVSRDMMQRCISLVHRQWPGADIKIGAQTYVEQFYASLGFVPVSEPYLEDGIPHLDMMLTRT